jgi:enoyl-CoA hydratase/carnithine racemase
MSDISVEIRPDRIAVIWLNRPARRNAISLAMWTRLRSIFEELDHADNVCAMVLTGTNGHFSAGADIHEFSRSRVGADAGLVYENIVDACYAALCAVGKPTVAAIEGCCIGGGCALALACDFRVAHRSAQIGIPAARLGTVYTVRESQLLVSAIGISNAKRILFSGKSLDGKAASAISLVDVVVDDDVLSAAVQFLHDMIGNAPLSVRGAKLVINAIAQNSVAERSGEIETALRRAFDSEDYQEGVRAFTEKRPPRFGGR